jgi:hypothetical protein
MSHALPQPGQLLQAIELYLSCAYDGTAPAAVKAIVESLRADPSGVYQAKAFVRDGAAEQPRLLLRLGNRHYPHMKLVLEPAPGAESYLFRADTHDRHICPAADHPEYGAFMDLRAKNQSIGSSIEQAWTTAGIPTFRTFLQQDLARRQAQSRGVAT